MDRATVLEQLTEVAVDVLGVDPKIVSETSSFKDDLDADSLDLVEVVMALEERFSISVPEEKLDGITTVGEAVDLVIGIADGDSKRADAEHRGDSKRADADHRADGGSKRADADHRADGGSKRADAAQPAAPA
jgi:acyl carrier protein